MRRAVELETQEQQSLLERHPNVASLTAGKRTILMREMLEDIGYVDCQVIDILTEGASLAGEIASSPIFVPVQALPGHSLSAGGGCHKAQ